MQQPDATQLRQVWISSVLTRLNSEMTDAVGLSHAHWDDDMAQKSAPAEDASQTALQACKEQYSMRRLNQA